MYNKKVSILFRSVVELVHKSKFEDEDESDRLILINQQTKFTILNKLATTTLTIPAISSPLERIFSQSDFIFRQHRAKMFRKTLEMITM